MRFFLLTLFALSSLLHAEPTGKRLWTSSTGSKIAANATHVEDGKIALLTRKGKTLLLSLEKFSAEDQAFLRKHFYEDFEDDDAPRPVRRSETNTSEVKIKSSEIKGPVQAADGSSYYYYLPVTLPPGGKAPLLFWTGSGHAHENTLKRFQNAADMTGIALAASVESKNGKKMEETAKALRRNFHHTTACLEHIAQNLPVSTERVFFTGSDGGGAAAWFNAARLPCLGAMPFLSYLPRSAKPSPDGLYFVAGGARDPYRYLTAASIKSFGDRATHYLYPGGHTMGNSGAAEEGLMWLYTRHIFEARSQHPKEAALFEKRLLTWLPQQKSYHTLFWADHLLNRCQLPASIKPQIQAMYDQFINESRDAEHLAARKALAHFSRDLLASEDDGSPQKKHTTKKIQKVAQKLQKQFEAIPEVSSTIADLDKETY